MKIVIAGAGEVGTHLAKMLSNENQDIIVIDRDERKLANLDNYNLMTYQGNTASFSDLKNIRVNNADLFIAVTPDETRNVMSCAMAKQQGAKKTVARIDNVEYLLSRQSQPFFEHLGVDVLICPEYLAAQEMIQSLDCTWARSWFELVDGRLILVGVKLRNNAQIIGQQLKEMGDVSQHMHVSAIKRNRETIIPGGDDRIHENDILYIATTREYLDEVAQLCGKTAIDVKSVFIMGGSRMAEQLARMIESRCNVKIIESDYARCQELSELLANSNVINGDPRDTDLLEEEGLSDYDVFVALSDTAEANILGCMMAKEHGVRKTIAHVENIQYISEAETLNIGTVINKKLLASSRIFQFLIDSDVDNARCLVLADAEVAELVVHEGSKVTKAPVKDLKLAHDMTIAGLVRDGEGYLVTGSTLLRPGDHVVVFCLAGAIHKIEKMFS